MNCKEFESTLNVLLDHRENPRGHAALMEHSADCDYCSNSLELYAAIGEYTEQPRPTSLDTKRRFTSYVAAVTAAAVLFLLLSPLGDFFARDQEQVNMAHASSNAAAEIASQDTHPSDVALNPDFWKNRPLARMMPINTFKVPHAPNLEEVGQSINSVWRSIQEDDYLLPIIKQSALFWMPKF